MPDIEIKRGYEVLPDNNVKFGIKITNISDLAIADVEVILDYSESLFNLQGQRVQKLSNIPPANTRTAEFILKPLGCVHKVNIEALISYRDPTWVKHVVTIQPKEVHCVCPFLKPKIMSKAEFLELLNSGHSSEKGLSFKGVSVDILTSYLTQTCKSRHYNVHDLSMNDGNLLYLSSESIGEKAYYLLTALIKEDEGLTQAILKATSDKPHGLNGFLNEIVSDLRHMVGTVHSGREIGVIKKEQIINIIDSVVQRTTFGGEGAASVNVEGSVVQRTDFKFECPEGKKQEEDRRYGEEKEQQKKEKENSIGMKFTYIPTGEFMMGSEDPNEKPIHKVNISKPFYLGTYQVTQREWKALMGSNPSKFEGDDLPVENVSWNDAQEFVKKLNAKEGTNKYRLPSEAEWEYVARAGTTTLYSFGDDKSDLGDYAWWKGNSGEITHPVGSKKPNSWGLYDMHGNVWDWLQDWWNNDYDGAPIDGSAWEDGEGDYRVIRGGSILMVAGFCMSAARNFFVTGPGTFDIGFRLLQEL